MVTAGALLAADAAETEDDADAGAEVDTDVGVGVGIAAEVVGPHPAVMTATTTAGPRA